MAIGEPRRPSWSARPGGECLRGLWRADRGRFSTEATPSVQKIRTPNREVVCQLTGGDPKTPLHHRISRPSSTEATPGLRRSDTLEGPLLHGTDPPDTLSLGWSGACRSRGAGPVLHRSDLFLHRSDPGASRKRPPCPAENFGVGVSLAWSGIPNAGGPNAFCPFSGPAGAPSAYAGAREGGTPLNRHPSPLRGGRLFGGDSVLHSTDRVRAFTIQAVRLGSVAPGTALGKGSST